MIVRRALAFLSVLAAVALLAPILPVDAWFVRILAFPRLQLSLLALLLAMWPLARGKAGERITVLSACLVAVGSLFLMAPWLRPGQERTFEPCDGSLDAMVVNVRRGNRDMDALMAAVAQEDPDVLLLLETDAWWDEQLAGTDGLLPHHQDAPAKAADYYGMHLFSRQPMEAEVRFLVKNDVPSIFAQLEGGVDVVGLHPRPPHFGETAELRDKQLQHAAEAIRDTDRPVVVLGDLNAVPWERVFERFQDDAALTDPREDLGRISSFRIAGFGAWPLDHVLWRGDRELRGYHLGQDVGSDHRPVVARLCPPG